MKRLAISLLGPMRVTLDGKPAQFEADTARALLAYLVIDPEAPHRRETLAGLLWPEQPERVAPRNLRQALRRLRGAIADREADPPFLLVTRKTVQVNPASDHWLDVTAFTEAIDASQNHRHRRLEVCGRCMQGLGEVVEGLGNLRIYHERRGERYRARVTRGQTPVGRVPVRSDSADGDPPTR